MEFYKVLLWKKIAEIFFFDELQTVKSKYISSRIYKILSSKYISAQI
jgi:hypothetical protein